MKTHLYALSCSFLFFLTMYAADPLDPGEHVNTYHCQQHADRVKEQLNQCAENAQEKHTATILVAGHCDVITFAAD